MQASKKVTVIPASLMQFSSTPITKTGKRRVAGYARVSTERDEQQNSYEAQVSYYTSYIRGRDDWEFVDVYTDEGISGTSTRHRDGFNRMIEDALAGKIDLILTKSVSRFARNTVDSLTTIRKLKDKGVEVYFEKENIWTFDNKGEILLTIMSSLAQEESRSISENIKWGVRKRFEDGKFSLGYKSFLGYDKGPDGTLVVNEEGAKVVRLIYGLFITGKSTNHIAAKLTEMGIPTPRGNKCWDPSTIKSILHNEKYAGEAILQKTYSPDFLTKKRRPNNGEVPKYHVENSHEAIIEKDVFDFVQALLKNHDRRDSMTVFSGKLICSECGNKFGSKIWHCNDKYRRVVWQCNGKYLKGCGCKTPHLTEDEIKTAFIKAQNSLMAARRTLVMEALEKATMAEFSASKCENELSSVNQEIEVVATLMQKSLNKPVLSSSGEGSSDFDGLAERYSSLKKRHDELEDEIAERKRRQGMLREFFKALSAQPDLITEFDPMMFSVLIDHATVYPEKRIVFTFRDGREV